MALSFSNLTASGSGTNLSSYNTASISPTAGALLLMAVETDQASGSTNVKPSVSGLSATWTEIGDVNYDTSGTTYRLTLFYGVGATGTGTITISYGGTAQGGCSWSVDQVTGADTSSPIVQTKSSTVPGSAATSQSLTLDSAITSGNGAWMAASWEAQESGSAESGWTLLGNGNHTGPAGAVCSMGIAGSSDQSGTISWTTSVANGALIAEIKAAGGSVTTLTADAGSFGTSGQAVTFRASMGVDHGSFS
jgi:hypothetical protein